MIVCICHRVSDRDIAREVKAGCRDFGKLQDELRVATACGACTDGVRQTFDGRVRAQHTLFEPTCPCTRPTLAASRAGWRTCPRPRSLPLQPTSRSCRSNLCPRVFSGGVQLNFGSLLCRWTMLLCAGLSACAHPEAPGSAQQRLTDAMRSRPIVLLGEVHDNAEQHALRTQALRELLASGARPALLMEQFDRERQADIDAAMARPGTTADDVIKAAGAHGTGWAWPLYRPFIALALEYRLPLVAANVSRADARRVSQEGLAATGFDAAVPAGITSYQTNTILASHCGMLNVAQARRMATAQVARDQFMARLLNEHSARGAVLLAGNGHVRNDVGVPTWLSPAVRQRSVGIGLLENGETGAEAYDRVITTAAPAARPDPCEGMKRPAS